MEAVPPFLITNPVWTVPESEPQAPLSDPVTVGLVEDDAYFCETVEDLLGGADDIVLQRTFSTCEAAIEAFEQGFSPEVVLMDIGLPGMSGIEGIRRLKALAPTAHVVMLTVHEDNDKIFEALCAGASGYLLKPSSKREIIAAVRAARRGGATINPQIAGKVLEMFSELAVPQGDYGLTDREREVLEELVAAKTKERIAEELHLSPHTVDTHVRNIYAKLHVHSRSGAVAKALKEGLLGGS